MILFYILHANYVNIQFNITQLYLILVFFFSVMHEYETIGDI